MFRLIGLGDRRSSRSRPRRAAPRVAAAHTVPRELRAEAEGRAEPGSLASLRTPVLFLLGEESPERARASTEELRGALPDSTITILPGQGHAATMTAPALVAEEIERFPD